MTPPTSWDNQEQPRPDYYVAFLNERLPGGTRRSRIVTSVVAAVTACIEKVCAALPAGVQNSPGASDAAYVVRDASSLAVDAVAGRMEGASLEGAFKQAQIEDLFASATLKNAQTAQLKQQMAWDDLKNHIELFAALGKPVSVSVLEDGTLCITVGDQIVKRAPPSASSDALPIVGPD